MTEFCNQTTILEFLSDSGAWVMSDEIWVRVMSYEYWVMKTESCLNQTGPLVSNRKGSYLLILKSCWSIPPFFFSSFFFRIVYPFLNPNYQNKCILFFFETRVSRTQDSRDLWTPVLYHYFMDKVCFFLKRK